ncbi:MAG: hypothetical protein RLZZ598_239, partial [Pseudomonadota bacterium]
YPALVTGGIEKTAQIDADTALQQLQMNDRVEKPDPFAMPTAPSGEGASAPANAPAAPAALEKEDPMKSLIEAMGRDAKKP